MSTAGKIFIVASFVAALAGQSSSSFAATTAAKTAPATSSATGSATAATGVVCQVTASGKYVHVQAINKGTAAVPAGETFAFTIIGPTKKMAKTYTFKTDLAPGKAVNVTTAIRAASVTGCSPSS